MSNLTIYCIMKNNRKRFALVHHYLETGIVSIVAFSDSMKVLCELKLSHPCYGSLRHELFVVDNVLPQNSISLTFVKDNSLINICKNVSEYLAVAEYEMLKKSYFKSSAWFEKAKNCASLGADIIENY